MMKFNDIKDGMFLYIKWNSGSVCIYYVVEIWSSVIITNSLRILIDSKNNTYSSVDHHSEIKEEDWEDNDTFGYQVATTNLLKAGEKILKVLIRNIFSEKSIIK